MAKKKVNRANLRNSTSSNNVANNMVKKASNLIAFLWALIAWLTGFLVSMAVGFGMINKTLTIPFINQIVTQIAGYVVIILIITGAILALMDKFAK